MQKIYKLNLDERKIIKAKFSICPECKALLIERLKIKNRLYVNHFWNRSKNISEYEMKVLVDVIFGIKNWNGNAKQIKWEIK
jgi:hypothetical protein